MESHDVTMQEAISFNRFLHLLKISYNISNNIMQHFTCNSNPININALCCTYQPDTSHAQVIALQ